MFDHQNIWKPPWRPSTTAWRPSTANPSFLPALPCRSAGATTNPLALVFFPRRSADPALPWAEALVFRPCASPPEGGLVGVTTTRNLFVESASASSHPVMSIRGTSRVSGCAAAPCGKGDGLRPRVIDDPPGLCTRSRCPAEAGTERSVQDRRLEDGRSRCRPPRPPPCDFINHRSGGSLARSHGVSAPPRFGDASFFAAGGSLNPTIAAPGPNVFAMKPCTTIGFASRSHPAPCRLSR
mmetsp:Transcript_12923/g.29026  ORF Transcript_12923/g.29026 Transcript_12923/m.29026 type:complete len:239 (-) Transcript_12923:19-735(-)